MLTFVRRISAQHSVRVRFSECSDGDARLPTFLGEERNAMTLPFQTHGAEVYSVDGPGEGNGQECDALLTTCPGAVLAVRIADCVPIAVYGTSLRNIPIVCVIHAGWRGIREGVIVNSLQQIREHGAHHLRAIIGPHISTECYEFGKVELEELVAALGRDVAGYTKDGRPALDLGSAVLEQLARNFVAVDHHLRRCTATDERYWSHRADEDTQRTALIAEIETSG
ncbi:MAG: polyphenol oxidase family protein [Actinomycetota bacterium]|nr:polyphenol oxidase family protein [Acidimicrobiales bacterium]MEC9269807.1 polyphenol oxidase family protein [Actinomycetota bacterium]MEC9315556.1 polyphenol oxidase family protein [Actinomycetota bacterium]